MMRSTCWNIDDLSKSARLRKFISILCMRRSCELSVSWMWHFRCVTKWICHHKCWIKSWMRNEFQVLKFVWIQVKSLKYMRLSESELLLPLPPLVFRCSVGCCPHCMVMRCTKVLRNTSKMVLAKFFGWEVGQLPGLVQSKNWSLFHSFSQ